MMLKRNAKRSFFIYVIIYLGQKSTSKNLKGETKWMHKKKLKMSDFNIRQTVVADANKRNTFIYPEALQMRDYEQGEDK
jgi:hypothetical protein